MYAERKGDVVKRLLDTVAQCTPVVSCDDDYVLNHVSIFSKSIMNFVSLGSLECKTSVMIALDNFF